MTDDSMDKLEVDLAARGRIHYEWLLTSLQKFRLFFVGLVFAILAFSVQFAIEPSNYWVNMMQVGSWFSLLITGILALRDTGGFVLRYTESKMEGLRPKTRMVMWSLFVIAMVLLTAVRVLN